MKTYFLQFGSGDPRLIGGMRPTFAIFQLASGVSVTPPGITEIPTSQGIFYFNWTPTTAIAFLADAATTSPGTTDRYIVGSLDPNDRCDEYATTLIAQGVTITAIGTTLIGIGTSLTSASSSGISGIGTPSSLMGDSVSMPTDLFGYLRRVDALLEGRENYNKATSILTKYDLTGATTLSSQTITNSASAVVKA